MDVMLKEARATIEASASTTRAKLIEAAYRCFERYGVQKTTMEDVASAAGCSRQTVYNNFATKNDLVTEICLIEATKLNDEIRRSLRSKRSIEDKMTESILVTLRVAAKNPYIRRLIEPADARARATEKGEPAHASQRQRWEPLVQQAIADGKIAVDVNIDDIVSWLTLAQMALLMKCDINHLDMKWAERIVRHFIIAPLLKAEKTPPSAAQTPRYSSARPPSPPAGSPRRRRPS